MINILILFSFSILHAQDDLSQLKGNFILCENIELSGLYSQSIRSYKFKCPKITGFVMDETPVKSAIIEVKCPRIKKLSIKIQTPQNCNTIVCIEDEKKLLSIFKDVPSPKCELSVISAELFEFYPLFKTPGPQKKEKFLDSMEVNNEADPDYLGRINGGYIQDQSVDPNDVNDKRPNSKIKKISINKQTQERLCNIESLETLDIATRTQTLEIVSSLYQNPNYQDEKLQRHLFCLLKNHFEVTEDYDQLMELIAKMKFKQEKCSK